MDDRPNGLLWVHIWDPLTPIEETMWGSPTRRPGHLPRQHAGEPATEVARRTGHCVAVLLKICADCIDGQADANRRINDALGAKDVEPGPDGEQDGGSE
jgi:hypothetical protein